MPELFAHPTVWSWFGLGYLFVPLVLPFFGLWWLITHRPVEPSRATDAASRRGGAVIVFRDPAEVPAGYGPSVVAIGKFDGVHSGHRAVIDRARVDAATGGARVVAVTFDRNPLALLRPEICPENLIGVHQKLQLLAETGIDATLMLRFDEQLAEPLRARVRRARARRTPSACARCSSGATSASAAAARATPTLLRELGAEFGFDVDVVDDVRAIEPGRRVSSTWIRELLARRATSRPPRSCSGARLRCGARSCTARSAAASSASRRRTCRPTSRASSPPTGSTPAGSIDEGSADGLRSGIRYPAAISVGTNPTFDDVPVRQVEAYVLDETDLDLYGHSVEVQFVVAHPRDGRVRGHRAAQGADRGRRRAGACGADALE